jgi:hypothetical protein
MTELESIYFLVFNKGILSPYKLNFILSILLFPKSTLFLDSNTFFWRLKLIILLLDLLISSKFFFSLVIIDFKE